MPTFRLELSWSHTSIIDKLCRVEIERAPRNDWLLSASTGSICANVPRPAGNLQFTQPLNYNIYSIWQLTHHLNAGFWISVKNFPLTWSFSAFPTPAYPQTFVPRFAALWSIFMWFAGRLWRPFVMPDYGETFP